MQETPSKQGSTIHSQNQDLTIDRQENPYIIEAWKNWGLRRKVPGAAHATGGGAVVGLRPMQCHVPLWEGGETTSGQAHPWAYDSPGCTPCRLAVFLTIHVKLVFSYHMCSVSYHIRQIGFVLLIRLIPHPDLARGNWKSLPQVKRIPTASPLLHFAFSEFRA